MRFVHDEELAAFGADVAAWVDAAIAPERRTIDERDIYPYDIVKDAARRGYSVLTLPPAYGGGGKGMAELAVVFEEIAKRSGAVAISLITIFQAQTMTLLYGVDRLKDELLPQFGAGAIAAYALTETAHGSDITTLSTKATRSAGGWTIEGEKAFITSGSRAELFMILAETPVGVSAFAVERERPGVSAYVGERSATIGLRNGPHVNVRFEGVTVPEHYLIGVEGKGVRQAVTVLNRSRVLAAAISIGLAESAYADALAWVTNRRAFGQSVFDFQGIQWKFADMRTNLEAARLLVQRAAYEFDRGRPAIAEASMAKVFASEAATKCVLEAMQMCGAYGVSENAEFGRYLRDAKAYEVAGGSSEILRNTIAKEIRKGVPSA